MQRYFLVCAVLAISACVSESDSNRIRVAKDPVKMNECQFQGCLGNDWALYPALKSQPIHNARPWTVKKKN